MKKIIVKIIVNILVFIFMLLSCTGCYSYESRAITPEQTAARIPEFIEEIKKTINNYDLRYNYDTNYQNGDAKITIYLNINDGKNDYNTRIVIFNERNDEKFLFGINWKPSSDSWKPEVDEVLVIDNSTLQLISDLILIISGNEMKNALYEYLSNSRKIVEEKDLLNNRMNSFRYFEDYEYIEEYGIEIDCGISGNYAEYISFKGYTKE